MPEVLDINSEFDEIIGGEYPYGAPSFSETALAADAPVPFGMFEDAAGQTADNLALGGWTNIHIVDTSGVEGEEGRKGGSGQGTGGDEYGDDHQTEEG